MSEMNVVELTEKHNKLAGELRDLGAKYQANNRWPDQKSARRWNDVCREYDVVAEELLLSKGPKGGVDQRLHQLDAHDSEPINPHNIGYADATPKNAPHRRGDFDTWLSTKDGQRVPLLGSKDSFAAATESMGDEVEDHRGVGVGEYLSAMAIGPRTREARNALQEGSDSAGGYTVPRILSSRLIDLMRKKTRVVQAGASTLPLTTEQTDFAKLLTDPTPAWRNELAEVAESEPTFGLVTFTARSLAVLVKVSEEVIQDSVNISRELPRILSEGMAQEVDRVALAGTGTDPQPRGLLNLSGIPTIDPTDANGDTPSDFTKFLSAVETLETANNEGPYSAILHPRTKATYDGLTDTTGQPLRLPRAIEDVRMLSTTQMPIDETAGTNSDASSALVGNFSDLVIGMRQNVRIEILKERFRSTLEYGYLVHLRMDVQVWRDSSFVRIAGLRAA